MTPGMADWVARARDADEAVWLVSVEGAVVGVRGMGMRLGVGQSRARRALLRGRVGVLQRVEEDVFIDERMFDGISSSPTPKESRRKKLSLSRRSIAVFSLRL